MSHRPETSNHCACLMHPTKRDQYPIQQGDNAESKLCANCGQQQITTKGADPLRLSIPAQSQHRMSGRQASDDETELTGFSNGPSQPASPYSMGKRLFPISGYSLYRSPHPCLQLAPATMVMPSKISVANMARRIPVQPSRRSNPVHTRRLKIISARLRCVAVPL